MPQFVQVQRFFDHQDRSTRQESTADPAPDRALAGNWRLQLLYRRRCSRREIASHPVTPRIVHLREYRADLLDEMVERVRGPGALA